MNPPGWSWATMLEASRRVVVSAFALWLGGEGERAGEQVKEHRSIATKATLNYHSVPYGLGGVKLFTHSEKKVGQV